MCKTRKAFCHCENGATGTEYAVMGAGIALAPVATVSGLGTVVLAELQSVKTGFG